MLNNIFNLEMSVRGHSRSLQTEHRAIPV